MQIERMGSDLHGIEKGTAVVLYHDHVFAQSREETELLVDLWQAIATKQTDEDGKETTMWNAAVIYEPPFNGRIVFPDVLGEEECLATFTQQAFDVMCDIDSDNSTATDLAFWPVDSTPAPDSGAYAVINGEMNDIPCIHIASKNRQRAIVVATQKPHVLDSVLEMVLGANRMNYLAALASKVSFKQTRRWNWLRERMELIAITVKTTEQAFNALAKYRSYLED
jgi:xanthine/CO dehydrogenase XdhC/CoxF family maturation factor